MIKVVPRVVGWICTGRHTHPLEEGKCPDDYIPDVFRGGFAITFDTVWDEEEE